MERILASKGNELSHTGSQETNTSGDSKTTVHKEEGILLSSSPEMMSNEFGKAAQTGASLLWPSNE